MGAEALRAGKGVYQKVIWRAFQQCGVEWGMPVTPSLPAEGWSFPIQTLEPHPISPDSPHKLSPDVSDLDQAKALMVQDRASVPWRRCC